MQGRPISLMWTVVVICGVHNHPIGLRLQVGGDQRLFFISRTISKLEKGLAPGEEGVTRNKLRLQRGTMLVCSPVLYVPPYSLALPLVSGREVGSNELKCRSDDWFWAPVKKRP